MNIIDKLIKEWAWRCDKGYPDINNPKDKAILHNLLNEWGIGERESIFKNLQEEKNEEVSLYDKALELLAKNKNNEKLLTRVMRTLESSSSVSSLKDLLNSSNINKNTFDDRNLPQEIISILQGGKENQVELFVNSIKERAISSQGNIYKEYPSELREKIKKIGELTGASNVVAMGRGEILFPLTYKDISILTGKAGDLDYKGKSVELKATGVSRDGKETAGARLGIGRSATRYLPLFVENNYTSLPDIIYRDFKESIKTEEPKKFISHVEDFLQRAFFGDSKLTINLEENNFNSISSINSFLYESLIKGYTAQKNIDLFLLYNPITGDYLITTPSELIEKINNRTVKTTGFTKSSTISQLISF